jgi:hypothetical protein
MPRRDAFSHLRQVDSDPINQPGPAQKPEPNFSPSIPAKQPLDLIPVAPRRTKRNREWDRAHQPEKVTYRGIPKRLQEMVNDLAEGLNVPRDELIRALLEFSLADLQANRLMLIAHPKARRMTLFPAGEAANWQTRKRDQFTAATWFDQAFPSTTSRAKISSLKKQRGKDQRKKERWETRTTYRLPVALKEQVKSLADEHDVPVGELVLFFLDHALGAYQAGELRLNPTPHTSGKTLFVDE